MRQCPTDTPSIWNNENVTVSKSGFVTVGDSVSKGTQITVTATSVYDSSKTGTATITVA